MGSQHFHEEELLSIMDFLFFKVCVDVEVLHRALDLFDGPTVVPSTLKEELQIQKAHKDRYDDNYLYAKKYLEVEDKYSINVVEPPEKNTYETETLAVAHKVDEENLHPIIYLTASDYDQAKSQNLPVRSLPGLIYELCYVRELSKLSGLMKLENCNLRDICDDKIINKAKKRIEEIPDNRARS